DNGHKRGLHGSSWARPISRKPVSADLSTVLDGLRSDFGRLDDGTARVWKPPFGDSGARKSRHLAPQSDLNQPHRFSRSPCAAGLVAYHRICVLYWYRDLPGARTVDCRPLVLDQYRLYVVADRNRCTLRRSLFDCFCWLFVFQCRRGDLPLSEISEV